ncbi:MAG: PHB depolymerase family esterase [Chitinophagaceae bacterium]
MKITSLLFIAFVIFSSCAKSDSSTPVVKTYQFSDSMVIDGITRTYTLNLPPDYYDSTGFSLVIAMHGGGGSAAQFESTSLLTEKANAARFIVVYPEGVKSTGLLAARTWNAGSCCDYAVNNNINDVGFISQLIDKMLTAYKINPKKVYATGHSNGGMLAYRLACEIPGKIAAIAPNASSMVVIKACNPSRPVPVLHMHSRLDTNVPYNGGKGTGPTSVYFPPIDSVLNVWSLKNICSNPSQLILSTGSYTFKKWTGCSNNVTIQFYFTEDGGHAWPGGLAGSSNGDTPSTAINANNLLWDFFQQYQLP